MTRKTFQPRRRGVVAAVVLTLAILGAGCTEEGPVSGTNVLLVGDSILTAAKADVIAALESQGWKPTVEAIPGTKVQDWLERLPDAVVAAQPNIAVIELGTNNCGLDECVDLGPYIDQVMFALESTDAVLWLNVQENPHPEILPENNWDYVNFEIEAAAARWPNMFLVDMDGRLTGHPEWHDSDGVHLNGEGNRQLAALIAESLVPFKPA